MNWTDAAASLSASTELGRLSDAAVQARQAELEAFQRSTSSFGSVLGNALRPAALQHSLQKVVDDVATRCGVLATTARLRQQTVVPSISATGNAIIQTGPGSSISHVTQQFAPPGAVVAAIDTLINMIQGADTLERHQRQGAIDVLEEVKAEAGKAQPKVGKVKTMLNGVKDAAEAVKGGGEAWQTLNA